MDRASDSGSEGWGFESLPACQGFMIPYGIMNPFFFMEIEIARKEAMQIASIARDFADISAGEIP